MTKSRNFCEKQQMWVFEPHFGEVRGGARQWLMARWKARGQLPNRLNWTFFAVCFGSGVMRRNVYSSAVFTGGWTSLHWNFTCSGSFPINYSWHQEKRHWATRWWRLHALRSFVMTQYWSVTDGQTDRRTDGFAVAYTALLRCAVKKKNDHKRF